MLQWWEGEEGLRRCVHSFQDSLLSSHPVGWQLKRVARSPSVGASGRTQCPRSGGVALLVKGVGRGPKTMWQMSARPGEQVGGEGLAENQG